MLTVAAELTLSVVVGTVLNAGVPCPNLRLDTGEVVPVQGVPSHVRTGDRIEITGRTRPSFSCGKVVFAAAEVRVLNVQDRAGGAMRPPKHEE